MMSVKQSITEHFVEPDIGLNCSLHKGWLSETERAYWWGMIMDNVNWYRVKYESNRFQTKCETPCYTTFFGGDPKYRPFVPIPTWLQPLVDRASNQLLEHGWIYNSILIRLYFDGKDEIAWHTDGRTFLGKEPTIGSLSIGGAATFEMRKMTNCWPCVSGTDPGKIYDDGIDRTTPVRKWKLESGDFFVMRGATQKNWHHRVPKEKGRRPRININFRMILPNQSETERGIKSYYKYMVHGDSSIGDSELPSWKYNQLLKKRNSLLSMFSGSSSSSSSSSRGGGGIGG
jgi:alkylated DNA repair dioxygenase AlkB